MVITEQEFQEWKENEVTKAFFKGCFVARERMKEQLILSLYDNPEFVCGKATVLQELLDMNYNEFMEAQQSD